MTKLSALDVFVIISYLASLAVIGVMFARRQTSLDTFLVAGRRMTWLPVGLSLMAALNSGVDYLTQPSATIQFGLVLLVGTLSWIALYPWVSTVVFPFYHRLHFYSVYEYLEARFDVRVRTLAAGIFILWRLGWMATALYVPCLAIDAVTGGRIDLTWMIIGLGALVTLYTMLGGIQAVVWNDVVQFFVMFAGLATTVVIVASSVPGGMSEVWRAAEDAGKISLWVPIGEPTASGAFDSVRAFFFQPLHVPALLSALIVGRMAQYTCDQVMVQRLQTTRTIDDARQAFIVNAAGDALWMAGLSVVGLALFAYFQHQPPPDGLQPDRMLSYFMARAFPAGAGGIVIAAILAASLSSIDSAIHACSSVLVVDGYNRLVVGRGAWSRTAGPQKNGSVASAFRRKAVAVDDLPPQGGSHKSDRHQVRVSRVATLVVGAAGTTIATNVSTIGSLIEIWNKLINSFSGPLFGIFILAMFSARTSSGAALAGGLIGAATSYYVAYDSGLGFLWPSTFGLAATLIVGGGVTLLVGRDVRRGESLTWSAVMKRQSP